MNKKVKVRSLDKKGAGRAFVYIITVILLALVIILWYKAVNTFSPNKEQKQSMQFNEFKRSIEGSVKNIYTYYNSIRAEKYHLPENFKKVCFVNMEYKATSGEIKELCKENAYACEVWKEGVSAQQKYDADPVTNPKNGYDSVRENVFLTPEGSVQIKVYKITIDQNDDGMEEGFLCEPITGGLFSLVLEGEGDHTKIIRGGEK